MRRRRLNARSCGSPGFTLIEVLLALALGALVFAAVAATVDSVAGLERRAARLSREDRLAQMLLTRMTRELTAVVRTADTTALVVIDRTRQDDLAVWTLAYGRPRRVQYSWNGERLDRHDQDPTLMENGEPVDLPGVTSLDIHLLTTTGRGDRWDEPALPSGVAIEVTIAGRVYGTIVAI